MCVLKKARLRNSFLRMLQAATAVLMAFKVVESFFAFYTAIHAFARGGAKLANELGVVRIAARALHGFLLKHFGAAKLLLWIGRGYAKTF